MGYWLFKAGSRSSRFDMLLDRLFKKFEVEFLKVGKFDIGAGETDVQLKIEVRFVKSGDFRLRLRVFEVIGRGRMPRETVHDLGCHTVVEGQKLRFDVVDFAFGVPGWDHERKRGWSATRERSLIGRSKNVAVFECQGRFTQRYRMFIEHLNHDVGSNVHKPSLYVQGEDEDIWDLSETNLLGDVRFH